MGVPEAVGNVTDLRPNTRRGLYWPVRGFARSEGYLPAVGLNGDAPLSRSRSQLKRRSRWST